MQEATEELDPMEVLMELVSAVAAEVVALCEQVNDLTEQLNRVENIAISG